MRAARAWMLCAGLAWLAPVMADNPVLIGAGLRSRPAYDGAAERRTDLIPVLRYYGAPWFLRTTQGMLEGGVRTDLAPGLVLGAQLAWEAGRPRDESAFLREHGIGNIGPGLSAGVHLEWDTMIGPSPVSVLARVRRDLRVSLGSHADLRMTAGIYGGTNLKAGLFVQATRADARAAMARYGLTQDQATAAALPAFDAQAGHLYTSFGLLWSWDLDRAWLLTGAAERLRMTSPLRASPLVGDASNEYVSLGLARRY